MTVTPEMIEAGVEFDRQAKTTVLTVDDYFGGLYLAMSQASPPPLDDEALANAIKALPYSVVFNAIAEAVKPSTTGTHISVNAFVTHIAAKLRDRAALSSCRIGTDGEALSLHKADRHE